MAESSRARHKHYCVREGTGIAGVERRTRVMSAFSAAGHPFRTSFECGSLVQQALVLGREKGGGHSLSACLLAGRRCWRRRLLTVYIFCWSLTLALPSLHVRQRRMSETGGSVGCRRTAQTACQFNLPSPICMQRLVWLASLTLTSPDPLLEPLASIARLDPLLSHLSRWQNSGTPF